MFRRVLNHLASAAPFLAALAILGGTAPPVVASVCGDAMTTLWSASGDITTTNDTGFVGCATTSTLAGNGVYTVDRDPYSITLSASGAATFNLLGSIRNVSGFGQGDSPTINLTVGDIDTGGLGPILGVTDNS